MVFKKENAKLDTLDLDVDWLPLGFKQPES
jgi:hypothetical protein